MVIGVYFGPSEYRKAQMDREVDRLCAVDGTIKVHEKVKLPADRFNKWGDPSVPLIGAKDVNASDYYLESTIEVIVAGDPNGYGSPALHRFRNRAVRASDGKVLGEAVGYYRSGGDADGPWHPSSYTGCSADSGKLLARAVFTRLQ